MKKKLSLFLLITIIAVFMAACGSNSSTEEKSNESAEPKETKETTELTIKHFLGETTAAGELVVMTVGAPIMYVVNKRVQFNKLID